MKKGIVQPLTPVTVILFFIYLLVSTPCAFCQGGGARERFRSAPTHASTAVLSDDELYLYRLIMNYRQDRGLPSISLSPNLSYVARLHARDLQLHPPSEPCSMHSWSMYGPWNPVCYTGTRSAKYMWSKPAELTMYSGKGYEIVAWKSDRIDMDLALSMWIDSPEHNNVILNAGIWSRSRWRAIGIAVSDNYAVVWFGEEPDYDR